MPRLLAFADAGCHSGFATVTHNILERLVPKGWDVHVLASNYRGDYWPTDLKLYVPRDGMYGQDRFIDLMASIMPDALFILNDPAVVMNMLLNNPHDPERVIWRGIASDKVTYKVPIVAYLPIDGYNSPKSWDVLADRVTRVAMSHFGQAAMPEAPVVWHGVDSKVFRPLDKREAKAALGFDPDRFLILRADKNSYRKNYPDTWRALRPVLRAHPDVDVHFHCQPVTSDGYNLPAVMWNDEDIRDRVTFTPNLGGFTGLTEDQLAILYSAADIFVSTSWGEGFGLTLLEAMACGTPVVATSCSSITEVVSPGALLIPPGRHVSVPMGQEQCLPNIDAFTAAIERLYRRPNLRDRLAADGVEHAQSFSWDTAAEKFDIILNRIITPP